MSAPTRRSDFTSQGRDGWFLVETSPRQYLVTNGRTFVERLQQILRHATFGARKAYRVGGPLGGGYLTGPSNTDFGEVLVDGRWGPVTNAALWRYIAERASSNIGGIPEQGDFDARSLEYLDAIEQSLRDRTISRKAMEAALFVWMSGSVPWSASSTIRLPEGAVLPRWDFATSLPDNPVFAREGPGEWVRWNEGQPEPGTMAPAPRPPQPPQPPPQPGEQPPGALGPARTSTATWVVGGVLVLGALGGAVWLAKRRGGMSR